MVAGDNHGFDYVGTERSFESEVLGLLNSSTIQPYDSFIMKYVAPVPPIILHSGLLSASLFQIFTFPQLSRSLLVTNVRIQHTLEIS